MVIKAEAEPAAEVVVATWQTLIFAINRFHIVVVIGTFTFIEFEMLKILYRFP